MSTKITDEELLDELKRICSLLKRTPKTKDITEHSQFSMNAYKRAFGGLANALIKINITPHLIKNQTKEQILQEIYNMYIKHGRVLTTSEFNTLSNTTFQTALKITNIPTWYEMLIAAGVPKEKAIITNKHISDDDLKEEVIRLKSLLGKYPNYYEMKNAGIISPRTYEGKFGTWVKAMHSLGFTDYVPQSFYKNQIYVRGDDGNLYRSAFEGQMGDLLFHLKNENKITNYSYELKVCNSKLWTCDFVITKLNDSELWVEMDGMGKNRKDPYDEFNEKINYYKEHNINYIIINYEEDIEQIIYDLI